MYSQPFLSPSKKQQHTTSPPEEEIIELTDYTPKQLKHHHHKKYYYYNKRLFTCLLLLLLLLLIYYHLTHPSPSLKSVPLLLISIDGLRPDYLQRAVTPTLTEFIHDPKSVVAQYLRPSFPTITFPNHYTLVTGKYPSEHGIVSNLFFDPVQNLSFNYKSPESNTNIQFWTGAKPVWDLVQSLGFLAAVYMWPGSEAVCPSIYMHYRDLNVNQSVSIVTHWLDPFNKSGLVFNLPPADTDDWPNWPGYKRVKWPQLPLRSGSVPPKLTALYLPQVDQAGHQYGPDSSHVDMALAHVDHGMNNLFRVLKTLGVWDEMNIVIVSDHGMASTNSSTLGPLRISLKNALGPYRNVVVVRDKWPIVMLSPINIQDTPLILAELNRNANKYTAYSHTSIPMDLHYSNNDRIPPIIVIPENKYQFEDDLNSVPVGMHGYVTNESVGQEMRAVFMARGPAFHKASGVVVPAFDNIEVYAILCKALSIAPQLHSGHGVPWM